MHGMYDANARKVIFFIWCNSVQKNIGSTYNPHMYIIFVLKNQSLKLCWIFNL